MLRSEGVGAWAEGRLTQQHMCLCPVGVLNVSQVVDEKHKARCFPDSVQFSSVQSLSRVQLFATT